MLFYVMLKNNFTKVAYFFQIYSIPHFNSLKYYVTLTSLPMLGGSLVKTAWCVLRLRMEGSPPGTEGSCEYIE